MDTRAQEKMLPTVPNGKAVENRLLIPQELFETLLSEIRRSTESGDLSTLSRIFSEIDGVTVDDAEAFRDFLVTQFVELKDLEPHARARLRMMTLASEEVEPSEDYTRMVAARRVPMCRDCKWFSNVPEGEDKTCVALGSKGTDQGCFGFTLAPQDAGRTTDP
jgi:hypothetical protein